ncbi:2518_t:CDS:2 [Rhizophagus irregularis]|nr:2518_t:CDS:2 [Rhizophagus irregularis]
MFLFAGDCFLLWDRYIKKSQYIIPHWINHLFSTSFKITVILGKSNLIGAPSNLIPNITTNKRPLLLAYLAAHLLISFYLKKNLLIPVPRDNRWFFDYLQLLNEYEELVSPRMNRFSRTRQNRIIFLNRIIRYYQKEFSSEIEEYLEYLKHEYEELLSLHS